MRWSRLLPLTAFLGLSVLIIYYSLPAYYRRDAAPGDRYARAFLCDAAPPAELLPAGVVVESPFASGPNPPVGETVVLVGEALTVHDNSRFAHPTPVARPIESMDMIITGVKSRVQALLADKSTVVISPYSKLVFDEVVYNPERDERETRVRLLFGRLKCRVLRLAGGREGDWQLETPTAVLGVRGSAFLVSVTHQPHNALSGTGCLDCLLRNAAGFDPKPVGLGVRVTTVVAGPDTLIRFRGRTGPAVTVGPCSASSAPEGGSASPPLPVTPELAAKALDASGLQENEISLKDNLTSIPTDGGSLRVVNP